MGNRNKKANVSAREKLRRLAVNLMGELDVVDNGYVADWELPRLLWQRYSKPVCCKVEEMNLETLGRIAGQGLPAAPADTLRGRTPMTAVLNNWTFGELANGCWMVQRIAAVVIVAEMTDVILERRRQSCDHSLLGECDISPDP